MGSQTITELIRGRGNLIAAENHRIRTIATDLDDSAEAEKEESSAVEQIVDNSAGAENEESSTGGDWNLYAASQPTEDNSDSAFGFDIESTVRSANDTVTGTFSV
ncbi:hypothetical protein K1719_015385 [Acacia pycnantha]|nr:hypothetical protein K1719_015385 [Acacia pycnantha]